MSIKVEQLDSWLNKEPIAEFINVMDYATDSSNNGIYYCKNGWRGYSFILEPNSFSSLEDHKALITFLDQDFPSQSAIQIVNFPSRNLKSLMEFYFESHKHYSNVKEPENLKMQNERRYQWLLDSIEKGLINDNFELYPKNWTTIVSVMIPEKNNKGFKLSDKDILRYKNKSVSKLYDFKPAEAKPTQLINIMNELLEPYNTEWDNHWDENTQIAEQVISSNTNITQEKNGTLVFKDMAKPEIEWYANVLTTKAFPEILNTAVTQNLFLENFDEKVEEPYIKTPFFTCSNIVIEDKDKEKGLAETKSKANQWQGKMMGDNGKKFFPKLAAIEYESEYLNYLITTKNESIFRMQSSIVVMSKSRSRLDEQVSSFESKFSKMNWKLQTEVDMALPVYLYSMPFQFDERYKVFSRRFKTTLRGNNVAATPMLNDMKGSWDKTPLCVQFGRTGQLQYFDNFGKDGNANMVVSAGSRAGKTFWMLDYVTQSLSAGRTVRIIEAGRNFEGLCEEFGGKFLRFREDDDTCLNFFTDAKTINNGTELHPEDVTTIIPLIGLMVGRKLIASNDDDFNGNNDAAIISSYVESAVKKAFKNNRRSTGLKEVGDELETLFNTIKQEDDFIDERLRDIMIALKPYSMEGGAFFSYFNGPRNVHFSDNALVVFELNDLKEKDENLMFVVLMALIQIVSNEFYGEELEDILKALIVDEAWMILNHPFIASFLIRVWRTIGKHKGCGISISQDINLYFANKDMEAIYNNSTYKVFLKQNAEELERLASDKKITSDKFFINKLKSLKSQAGYFAEMLVKVDNDYFISRIIVDRFAFYLYSTPDKVEGFIKVMKHFGIKKSETAFIFAYVDLTEGATYEDGHNELLINQGKIKRKPTVIKKTEKKTEKNIVGILLKDSFLSKFLSLFKK